MEVELGFNLGLWGVSIHDYLATNSTSCIDSTPSDMGSEYKVLELRVCKEKSIASTMFIII